MSEFFEKTPLSGVGKYPDFQVTSCHHFDSTSVDFAYIESEYRVAPDHERSEEKDMKESQFEKIAKICR
jgi:hypothetical protein